MKFCFTILFLIVFEFANAQVAGTPYVSNRLFAKFSFNLTTTSSTTVDFTLHVATNSSRPILECGVVYSYNNNATTSNNQGKWVAATNFDGINVLTTTITNTFVYAPYYAIPYVILSTGTYYGDAVKFTPNWATVTINGKVWAAANLGATMIATNAGVNSNMYGFYYQWGRGSDGHQLSSSTTTSTIATSSIPGNSNFITNNSNTYDWMTPQDVNLWQGLNGQNNPCPSGYRLPTIDEYKSAGPTLLLPNSSYRRNSDGALVATNWGYFWSSTTVNKTTLWKANVLDRPNGSLEQSFANAFPIRCIQD
jgi:hypothetical protein